MRFSGREVKDLLLAGALISLAFAILFSGGLNLFSNFGPNIIILFIISFFTAGVGFLMHELMHKIVAQRYGLRAEFYAYYPMLLLAVGFSFFGFIFAAPGAVYIFGHMNREKNGKISLAGPLTNIGLSMIFIVFLFLISGNTILRTFFSYGLSINSLLAAFNMIPAMPFDGAKIIAWNKKVYFSTLAISLLLFIISFFL